MNKTGLSYSSVQKIIHNELRMFKVSAHWVLRLLTPFQKETAWSFKIDDGAAGTGLRGLFLHLVTMDEPRV